VGARRVRELFNEARNYPEGCIIFIDEIDSIGRKRNSPNSNDATSINQLLSELDGFQPRENIVILAATNTPEILDNALLRPGRFDRQIYISLPNRRARQEIIRLATTKTVFHPEVNLAETISLTEGLSGAQIVNLFNEANILSLRQGQNMVDQTMIFEAYDRILLGPASTSHTISLVNQKITAYHEAGHALIGLSLPETTVKKITIVPRSTAGGYTWTTLRSEEDDDQKINKSQILARIAVLLGGRASEELIFGPQNITIGAYDDLKKVSTIVQDLIFRYGMSELGIIPTAKNLFSHKENFVSLPEKNKEKIAAEQEKILQQC
jgi:cell division protease FtsH